MRAAILVVCLAVLMPPSASAQEPHTLAGRVVDVSGAVIVGAEVKLTDEHGRSWQTRSDGAGEFRFGALLAGNYTVQVEHRQFVLSPDERQLRNPGHSARL